MKIYKARTDYMTFMEISFRDGSKHWMTWEVYQAVFKDVYYKLGFFITH